MSTEEGSDSSGFIPVFVPPLAEELSAMLPQYEISGLIASGGMGAVYRGVQRALERPVAIKILPPEAARDGEAIGRFRTEARAMARLIHPNIPAVYDFDVTQGYCYFAMEFIEGKNVFHLIRQGQLPPDRALEIFSQVCDALHFAHSRGIMHGDIKPANILVNSEGTVKLADFGLAQLMEHSSGRGTEQESWSAMGTPEYAAPELFIKGAAVGPPADVYSLGPLLYEMLTGAPPQGRFELPARALKMDPLIDTVISTCMRQDPAARYPNPGAARRDIDAIRRKAASFSSQKRKTVKIVRVSPAGKAALRPGSTGASQASHKKPRRAHRGMLFGGLIALIGVGAGVMIFSSRRPAQPPPPPPEQSQFIRPLPKNQEPAPAGRETAAPAPSPPPAPPPPSVREREEKPEPLYPVQTIPADPVKVSPPPAVSRELRQKLDALLAAHRSAWHKEVKAKQEADFAVIQSSYRRALSKLDEEYLIKNDAAGLLAVRSELDRFQAAPTVTVPEEKLSGNKRVLEMQGKLTAEILRVRKTGEEVWKRYVQDLKALETTADEGSPENRKMVAAALAAVSSVENAARLFEKALPPASPDKQDD